MHINSILTFTALLGLTSAVDVWTYPKTGCPSKGWSKCVNPKPGQCCVNAKSMVSYSIQCTNCSERHRYGSWRKSGSQVCYSLVTAHQMGKKPYCVNHGGAPAHGSRWVYHDPGKKRSIEEGLLTDEELFLQAEGAELPCATPDVISINGRVFKFTENTPESWKDELFDLYESEDPTTDLAKRSTPIPEKFREIEITGTPEAQPPPEGEP